MDEKRRWRVIWHWTGKDGGPRCTLSDHASKRAAERVGKAQVVSGATHYEVIDRAIDRRP